MADADPLAAMQPDAGERFEMKFRIEARDAQVLSQHIRWTALERLSAALPALAAGVLGAFVADCLWTWALGRVPLQADVSSLLNWMIAGGIAAFLLFVLLVEPARRRSVARARTISMGEAVLVAENESVTVTTAGIVTIFPWSRLQSAAETKDHILLMYSRVEGLIVPKRAFASPEQSRGFMALVRSRVAHVTP
jgi:YcxB-like protein